MLSNVFLTFHSNIHHRDKVLSKVEDFSLVGTGMVLGQVGQVLLVA